MQQNMDKTTYDDMSTSSTPARGDSQRGAGETGGASPGGGEQALPGPNHQGLLGWDALEAATGCLKSVAHPVRLRILELLLDGEYPVGELAELCEVDQPAASGHLRQLRDRGILDQRRDGRRVFYRVAAPAAIQGIVNCMRRSFGPSGTGTGCRG